MKNKGYLLAGVIILLAIIWVWRLINAVQRLKFEIVGVDYAGQGGLLGLSPKFSVWVEFENPSTTTLQVESLYFDVYAKGKAGFFYIGKISDNTRFSIPSESKTKKSFTFQVDSIATAEFLYNFVKDGQMSSKAPQMNFKGFVRSGIATAKINYLYA